MEQLANGILFMVEGLGIFVLGLLALAITGLFLFGLGQLGIAVFGYALPRLGLKLVRDARNGDLPFNQLLEELTHPPQVRPILGAARPRDSGVVEGEYEKPGTSVVRR